MRQTQTLMIFKADRPGQRLSPTLSPVLNCCWPLLLNKMLIQSLNRIYTLPQGCRRRKNGRLSPAMRPGSRMREYPTLKKMNGFSMRPPFPSPIGIRGRVDVRLSPAKGLGA